ncbi:hypothetical protein [Roseovarius sp. D0-M9]|uniref:hypothetical protein n=1 Tax=Roseovarius sp. D0-M9 TaxID=3127117 RepID=UPI00300FE42D
MSGTLGAVDLTADTDAILYTVPASKVATVVVSLCNRAAAEALIRVAISTQAAAPVSADFIEYDVTLPPNGVLERSALVLGAGEKVFVRASTGDVTARVHGFEQEV